MNSTDALALSPDLANSPAQAEPQGVVSAPGEGTPDFVLLSEPPRADASLQSREFWPRLLLCLAIAVLATWWVIHYTEWFEIIGSLLGLTGVFAWLGIVFKLVPKERLEGFQKNSFLWLWSSRNATWVLGLLLVAALAISFCFGTLQLESVQGEYLVWISRASTPPDKEDEAERIPASGRLRTLKLASWLAGDYQVRVSGFPEQTLTAKPWWRQDRQLPYSFLRPVVLIWPEISVIKQLTATGAHPARLYVQIDGETFLSECRGESLWVGYQGSMMVPKYVRDVWPISYQAEPALLGLLLQPRSMKDWPKDTAPGQAIPGTPYTRATKPLPTELKPGQKIQGLLYRSGSKSEDAATAIYTVRSVQESTDMVQPVPLLKKP